MGWGGVGGGARKRDINSLFSMRVNASGGEQAADWTGQRVIIPSVVQPTQSHNQHTHNHNHTHVPTWNPITVNSSLFFEVWGCVIGAYVLASHTHTHTYM